MRRMEEVCPRLAGLGEELRFLMINYIFGVTAAAFMFFNLAVSVFTPLVERQRYHAKLPEDIRRGTPVKMAQLLICPLLMLGYPALAMHYLGGCSVVDLWFYTTVPLVPAFELYELARLWPLRPALTAHHLATLCAAMAFMRIMTRMPELRLLPSIATFSATIGLQWVADFFAIVLRYTRSRRTAHVGRAVYLASGVPRALNTGILAHLTVSFYRDHDAGLVPVVTMGLLTLAYASIHWGLMCWAALLDVGDYFASHQARWEAELTAAAANGKPKSS